MYKPLHDAGHNMHADLRKRECLMLDFSKCFLFTSIWTCVSLSVIQLRKRNVLDSAGQKWKLNQNHLAVFLQWLRAKLHPSPPLSGAGRRHSTRDLYAHHQSRPIVFNDNTQFHKHITNDKPHSHPGKLVWFTISPERNFPIRTIPQHNKGN